MPYGKSLLVTEYKVLVSKHLFCFVRFKCNLLCLFIHAVCSKLWFCLGQRCEVGRKAMPFNEACNVSDTASDTLLTFLVQCSPYPHEGILLSPP